jgi:hypothetical protein
MQREAVRPRGRSVSGLVVVGCAVAASDRSTTVNPMDGVQRVCNLDICDVVEAMLDTSRDREPTPAACCSARVRGGEAGCEPGHAG